MTQTMTNAIVAVPCVNGNVYIRNINIDDVMKLTHDPDVIPIESTTPFYNIKELINCFIRSNLPLITSDVFFQQNNAEKYAYEPIVANSMDNAISVIGFIYAQENTGTIVYNEIIPFDMETLRNMFAELHPFC